MQKRALILGINGQDGSYLAEVLLDAGYDVHGVVRRNSQPNLWRIQHLLESITIHQGDLLDFSSIHSIFWKILPDEVYNEADQDHVGFSTATPSYSAAVTYGAVANLLELIRMVKTPKIKFFQPLSATMFGDAPAPQSLKTPFNPQSPYACAKVAAYYLCKHYREKHGVFVSTVILYNHDSVRRQGDYLLHKICKAAVQIWYEDVEYLMLSNPELRVDIGHAQEFMEGVHKLVQLDTPQDLVVGTGIGIPIKKLVESAFHYCGLLEDKFREIEGNFKSELIADTTNLQRVLNWVPTQPIESLIGDLCQCYKSALYGAS